MINIFHHEIPTLYMSNEAGNGRGCGFDYGMRDGSGLNSNWNYNGNGFGHDYGTVQGDGRSQYIYGENNNEK